MQYSTGGRKGGSPRSAADSEIVAAFKVQLSHTTSPCRQGAERHISWQPCKAFGLAWLLLAQVNPLRSHKFEYLCQLSQQTRPQCGAKGHSHVMYEGHDRKDSALLFLKCALMATQTWP